MAASLNLSSLEVSAFGTAPTRDADLLDNADRHGGGATAVRMGRTSSHAWLAVEDAGRGVPPEQREYVSH